MITNGRSNRISRIKGPFKVLVTLVTLWSFLFNMVSYDLAWAARTPLEPTAVGSNRAGSPDSPGFIIKELSVDTFALPEYLGYIKDSWKGNSPDKVVIHIQDAHCNYAAQTKIAEIIEYLNKEYGIDSVNLEGGAKGYDLSTFTRIDDKDIREKTADYFVRQGLVNGAEFFAINNPEKITLWGIEDTKLYLDNLNIYRDSLKYKDEVDKHLNAITHILANLKSKIYSQELLELDTKYSQYKAGSLEFKDYLAYLVQIAKQKAIDIKASTNIYILNQTLGQEGGIDFKKANNQRDDLIDKLSKKLSKKSLEELVSKTVEFRSEKISQKDFYAYLTSKANFVGIELKYLPDLQKYIVYISMYNAIDKMKIMEEMYNLENKIKEDLYQNDKQRELNKLSKNLALLKNIFSISLTKEDYKYYLDNEESFNVSNYVSFINKVAPLYKITAQLDKNITDLDINRESISKFYEYSFKRDNVFLKNIRFNKKIALVVTGGFHTENLCEIFKKDKISYISIMPTFNNSNGYECPYFSLLAGKESPLLQKLQPIFASAASIQIASMLSGAIAPEVWGRANIDAFRAAALIQEKIEQGKKVVLLNNDGTPLLDKKTGQPMIFGEGTEEPITVRSLLDAIHQKDIDGQMEKLPENAFEDISNINSVIDEVKAFLKSIGASQKALDEVDVLKGKRDGRALVRFVNGVTFVGHAGGQGIRINSNLKGNDKEVKAILIHEIIAGLFGNHLLAERVEQLYRANNLSFSVFSKTIPYVSSISDPNLQKARRNALENAGGDQMFGLIRSALKNYGRFSDQDQEAIVSMLGHFVANAIDAVCEKIDNIDDAGQQRLAVKDARLAVSIRHDPQSGNIEIVLSDNGIGIAKETFEDWVNNIMGSSKVGRGYLGESGVAVLSTLNFETKNKFDVSFVSKMAEGNGYKFTQNRDGARSIAPVNKDMVGTDVIITVPRDRLVMPFGTTAVANETNNVDAGVLARAPSLAMPIWNMTAVQRKENADKRDFAFENAHQEEVLLGGDRKGGRRSLDLKEGEGVWITAGVTSFKIWIENGKPLFLPYQNGISGGKPMIIKLSRPYSIGRNPENIISVPDPILSSHHAIFSVWHAVTEGAYSINIEDVGSTNGTMTKRISIPPASDTKKLSLGKTDARSMEVLFDKDVWVGAGSYRYRIWKEAGGAVKISRYADGQPVGPAQDIKIGQFFSVGRLEGAGNDMVANDGQLSSIHFAVRVAADADGKQYIKIADMGSKNGTVVEWEIPGSGEIWDALREGGYNYSDLVTFASFWSNKELTIKDINRNSRLGDMLRSKFEGKLGDKFKDTILAIIGQVGTIGFGIEYKHDTGYYVEYEKASLEYLRRWILGIQKASTVRGVPLTARDRLKAIESSEMMGGYWVGHMFGNDPDLGKIVDSYNKDSVLDQEPQIALDIINGKNLSAEQKLVLHLIVAPELAVLPQAMPTPPAAKVRGVIVTGIAGIVAAVGVICLGNIGLAAYIAIAGIFNLINAIHGWTSVGFNGDMVLTGDTWYQPNWIAPLTSYEKGMLLPHEMMHKLPGLGSSQRIAALLSHVLVLYPIQLLLTPVMLILGKFLIAPVAVTTQSAVPAPSQENNAPILRGVKGRYVPILATPGLPREEYQMAINNLRDMVTIKPDPNACAEDTHELITVIQTVQLDTGCFIELIDALQHIAEVYAKKSELGFMFIPMDVVDVLWNIMKRAGLSDEVYLKASETLRGLNLKRPPVPDGLPANAGEGLLVSYYELVAIRCLRAADILENPINLKDLVRRRPQVARQIINDMVTIIEELPRRDLKDLMPRSELSRNPGLEEQLTRLGNDHLWLGKAIRELIRDGTDSLKRQILNDLVPIAHPDAVNRNPGIILEADVVKEMVKRIGNEILEMQRAGTWVNISDAARSLIALKAIEAGMTDGTRIDTPYLRNQITYYSSIESSYANVPNMRYRLRLFTKEGTETLKTRGVASALIGDMLRALGIEPHSPRLAGTPNGLEFEIDLPYSNSHEIISELILSMMENGLLNRERYFITARFIANGNLTDEAKYIAFALLASRFYEPGIEEDKSPLSVYEEQKTPRDDEQKPMERTFYSGLALPYYDAGNSDAVHRLNNVEVMEGSENLPYGGIGRIMRNMQLLNFALDEYLIERRGNRYRLEKRLADRLGKVMPDTEPTVYTDRLAAIYVSFERDIRTAAESYGIPASVFDKTVWLANRKNSFQDNVWEKIRPYLERIGAIKGRDEMASRTFAEIFNKAADRVQEEINLIAEEYRQSQPPAAPPAPAAPQMPPGMGGVGFRPDNFNSAFDDWNKGNINLEKLLERIGGLEGLLWGLKAVEEGDQEYGKIRAVLLNLSPEDRSKITDMAKDWAILPAHNISGKLEAALRSSAQAAPAGEMNAIAEATHNGWSTAAEQPQTFSGPQDLEKQGGFKATDFVLVRCTSALPDGGFLRRHASKKVDTAKPRTGKSISERSSIHFCLNHTVEGHEYGQWDFDENPYVILIPLHKVPKRIVESMTFVDTWVNEDVELPEGSIILGSENAPVPSLQDLGKAQYLTIKTMSDAVKKIQELGYTYRTGGKWDYESEWNDFRKALNDFCDKEAVHSEYHHTHWRNSYDDEMTALNDIEDRIITPWIWAEQEPSGEITVILNDALSKINIRNLKSLLNNPDLSREDKIRLVDKIRGYFEAKKADEGKLLFTKSKEIDHIKKFGSIGNYAEHKLHTEPSREAFAKWLTWDNFKRFMFGDFDISRFETGLTVNPAAPAAPTKIQEEQAINGLVLEREIKALADKIGGDIFIKFEGKIDISTIEKECGAKYLGSGGNGYAFRFKLLNQDIVIKFFHKGFGTQAGHEAAGLQLGIGLPLFQQYINHENEGNSTVGWIASYYVPGETFKRPSYSEQQSWSPSQQQQYYDEITRRIQEMPNEHWDQLVKIFQEAEKLGIGIDPKPGNFIYDKNKGFVVIDYHDGRNNPNRETAMDCLVKYCHPILIVAGQKGVKEHDDLIRQKINEALNRVNVAQQQAQSALAAPVVGTSQTSTANIPTPGVRTTEGYVNEAILKAHHKLTSKIDSITAQQAAQMIIEAIMTMPDNLEGIQNMPTAIGILTRAINETKDQKLIQILQILKQYEVLAEVDEQLSNKVRGVINNMPAYNTSAISVAETGNNMTRRDFLKKAATGVALVAASGAIGGTAWSLLNDSSDLKVPESLTEKLASSLAPLGATQESIRQSIQISNSKSFQNFVKNTYKKLRTGGAWRSDERYPVLFLHGCDKAGFAQALTNLGIIIVPLGNLPFDLKSQISWLGVKIAHEGTHITNHRNNPDMALLEDEWRAYENTTKAIRLFEPENTEQIKVQQRVSDAFRVLLDKKSDIVAIFGGARFEKIYYEDIDVRGDFVGIHLYNTIGEQKTVIWVDTSKAEINTKEPILEYETEVSHISSTMLPAIPQQFGTGYTNAGVFAAAAVVGAPRSQAISTLVTTKEQTMPVAAETPANPLPVDTVESRNDADSDIWKNVGMPDLKVVTLVGVEDRSKAQPVLSKINNDLKTNGFNNDRNDNQQVMPFDIIRNDDGTIDMKKTKKNMYEAIDKNYRDGAMLAVFAPQLQKSELENDSELRAKCKDKNIIIIPDSYSDSSLSPEVIKAKEKGQKVNTFIDIKSRVITARLFAFCRERERITGKEDAESLKTLTDYLGRISDNKDLAGVSNLMALLKKLNDNALRIRPILYKAITDWQIAQKATGISA